MKSNPVKIGWLAKIALKYALRWLVKNFYRKLTDGLWVKIPIDNDIIHIYIKLEDKPPPIVEYLHLD